MVTRISRKSSSGLKSRKYSTPLVTAPVHANVPSSLQSPLAAGGAPSGWWATQFDHFNIQFTYPNGGINESMCRQIDGCANEVSDYILGTEGYSNCKDTIFDLSGKVVWKYQEAGAGQGPAKFNPYDPEHVDFINAIRTNQPMNEAGHLANSTLIGIMGRAAYTGKEVTWDEMLNSNERLSPLNTPWGGLPSRRKSPCPAMRKMWPSTRGHKGGGL